jgi:Holliday junction resolvase
LAKRLHSQGFFVTRAAGSGTAMRESVDIVAMNKVSELLIECKTYHGEYEGEKIDFDEEQLKTVDEKVNYPGEFKSGETNTVIGVAVKCVDGGIAQFYEGTDSPLVTVEDTIPLYQLVNDNTIPKNDG